MKNSSAAFEASSRLSSSDEVLSQNGTDDASISGGGPGRFSVVPASGDSVSFFETFFLE